MPTLELTPHLSSPKSPIRSIGADIRLSESAALIIRYWAKGSIADVSIPPIEQPARADELWRHTCFEAFLGRADSDAYFEFNFSPSTRWAAYRFTAYREGMSVAQSCPPPKIDITRAASELSLTAVLPLEWVGSAALVSPMRVALSAIVQSRAGAITCWALAHPSEKPDFHHPDSFVCDLKKESRS